MLANFRKGAAAFATITALFATSAQAETYEILVFEKSYFPEITYIKAGDTIVFKNDSSVPHTVTASDNSWTVDSIPQGGEASIQITNNMATQFSGLSFNSATIVGFLDFSAPLLEGEATQDPIPVGG